MATQENMKSPGCLVTSIYFNYYQAERELQHNPRPECGMNVLPEGVSRFPTIPFNAVAFAMDATCKTAYQDNIECKDCPEKDKKDFDSCYLKQKLKLHAEFKGKPNTSVLVRTIDPSANQVEGLYSYLQKARIAVDDSGNLIEFKRLLGDIEPITVNFNEKGNSFVDGSNHEGVVEITIADADIWSNGICASWQLWQWQYSTDQGKTWEIAGGLFHEGISAHRVFITKKPATWPWTGYDEEVKSVNGVSSPSRWPYLGALEWACKWAEGETTDVGIASKITARLNDGTGDRFKYQDSGVNNYTSVYYNYFDCGRFIDRLNGKFGRGPNVNCVDCAHMVISLANALGCQLQAGKIRNKDIDLNFELNPLTLIGHNELAPPDKTFAYHQVAYNLNMKDSTLDQIFDACIKFDEEVYANLKSKDPTAPAPETDIQLTLELNHGHPVDIPLGKDVFSFGYLAILAKAHNEATQKNLKMYRDEGQVFSISALK